jgi:hypothetical protein
MQALGGAVWFLGDLDDPWVVSIADALPTAWNVQRRCCAGDLPERPFDVGRPPRLVVLHRHKVTTLDCQRLRDWRDHGAIEPRPSLVLCASSYVRFEELERAAGLVDRILPEATAPDVLQGHVRRMLSRRRAPASGAQGPQFRIDVSGSTQELARTLVDACASWGYRAAFVPDLTSGEPAQMARSAGPPRERVLTVWEVPVLEPHWREILARCSDTIGPVIALMGFPDRASVSQAKKWGALACLELPCDLEELRDVIESQAPRLPLERWRVPARAEPRHLLPPRSRRRKAESTISSVPSTSRVSDHTNPTRKRADLDRRPTSLEPVWSEDDEQPTIS